MRLEEKIEALRRQGVEVLAPATLEIGDEVRLDRIRGPRTVLHACTKLYGRDLFVAEGARIGYEEPATLEDCAVGPGVKLGGGYFAGAVFLHGVVFGKGGHVRAGTLMEEESNAAHTVGLKQTILFPFVTLGSLINFCDVLMSGGTSRKDHSEVGSSFIHFNYTPFGRNGDKATPSLVGDVPHGALLRSRRVFLGGQGGLVGPLEIRFGTVLAAGFVYRLDHGPDELVVGESLQPRTTALNPLRYFRVKAKVEKNLRYLGNLFALRELYARVRLPLAGADPDRKVLCEAALKLLGGSIAERVSRLGQVAGYMEDSIPILEAERRRSEGAKAQSIDEELAIQRALPSRWGIMERALLAHAPEGDATDAADLACFSRGLEEAAARTKGGYVEAVKALGPDAVEAGTRWLGSIVTAVERLLDDPRPS